MPLTSGSFSRPLTAERTTAERTTADAAGTEAADTNRRWSSSASTAADLAAPAWSGGTEETGKGATTSSKAVDDFLKYMKMTPEERVHEAMLKKLGLSEEEFQALSPEKRAALEESFAKTMQQEMEQQARKGKPGQIADFSV
ncbi:hypothetical protein [Oleisolibacter albus]|uniref:hypothetical protein n=1 Tax=Oleisolibacter albus TaxID=2171757 RepID=UPI000DF316D4|nr:hypothetical protein [Oleisolibacter albus]